MTVTRHRRTDFSCRTHRKPTQVNHGAGGGAQGPAVPHSRGARTATPPARRPGDRQQQHPRAGPARATPVTAFPPRPAGATWGSPAGSEPRTPPSLKLPTSPAARVRCLEPNQWRRRRRRTATRKGQASPGPRRSAPAVLERRSGVPSHRTPRHSRSSELRLYTF